MMRALPYLLGHLLPPIVIWSALTGGVWAFTPVAVAFVALPIIDLLSGLNPWSPDEAEGRRLEDDPAFRAITWLWVPVQMGLLLWALAFVASGALAPWEIVALAGGVGICTGTVGITFAHELVHRVSRGERALGEILLTPVSYPHFAVEHVYGHHRHVGTPADPATARYGESFWRFLPRTVAGSLRSAVHLEAARVSRRYGSAWHPANRILRYALLQPVLYAAVWLAFGPVATVFLALQAAVAIAQLEVINYVEHYGLTRREVSPGVYERIQPWHSWDSHYRVSNWLLINLARHADHHCLASRRYPALHARGDAPQLPAGYGTMFLLALVPPLWHRVMDPRVRDWQAKYASSAA